MGIVLMTGPTGLPSPSLYVITTLRTKFPVSSGLSWISHEVASPAFNLKNFFFRVPRTSRIGWSASVIFHAFPAFSMT